MCRIGQYGEGESPSSSQELAQRILTTVYMGTEVGWAGQERMSYRAGWVDGCSGGGRGGRRGTGQVHAQIGG